MAFVRVESRTPTSIGLIEVHLADQNGNNNERGIRGSVRILDQNGEQIREWQGDLRQHLTAAQLNGLVALLDALRTKAAAEFLP